MPMVNKETLCLSSSLPISLSFENYEEKIIVKVK